MFQSYSIPFEAIRVLPIDLMTTTTAMSLETWKQNDHMHPYFFNRSTNDSEHSSWIHQNKFHLEFSTEIDAMFNSQNLTTGDFTLLKYERDDFFKPHVSTKLSKSHQYTCLLFVPYNDYKGGELLIKGHASYIQCFPSCYPNSCTMIILSIDMVHEISPVTRGIQHVFMAPVYTLS